MDPNRFRTEGVPRRQAIVASCDIALGVAPGDSPFGHVPPRLAKSLFAVGRGIYALFAVGRGIYALAHTWIVQLTRAPPPGSDKLHESNHSDPGLQMDLMYA